MNKSKKNKRRIKKKNKSKKLKFRLYKNLNFVKLI